jgi:hypothetical protein
MARHAVWIDDDEVLLRSDRLGDPDVLAMVRERDIVFKERSRAQHNDRQGRCTAEPVFPTSEKTL